VAGSTGERNTLSLFKKMEWGKTRLQDNADRIILIQQSSLPDE
jgi:hypothetical protein